MFRLVYVHELVFLSRWQELEFELPVDDDTGKGQGGGDGEADSPSDDECSSLPVLRVNLSNGGEMALRSRDVKVGSFQDIFYKTLAVVTGARSRAVKVSFSRHFLQNVTRLMWWYA